MSETTTQAEAARTVRVDASSGSSAPPRARGRDFDGLPEGTTLLRYLVIEQIGRGGMGVVYRAYDPKLEREVAIKCLRAGRLAEQAKARMVREAQAMAKLNHPNVVSIYDVHLEDEGVVLAMEYVRGTTLSDWLKKSPRTWQAVVTKFVQAGHGLAAAHQAGLLHRDFKPANVLVGDGGQVKVTDFGLARDHAARSTALSRSSVDDIAQTMESGGCRSPLTLAGTVMGTPEYMAPEQFGSIELDARADQYAFCASLWQGLTGQVPFPIEGEVDPHFGRRKLAGPPAWPRDARVPRRVVHAVLRGLCGQRSERWHNMAELLEALSRRPWFNRGGVALGASAVVALGSVVALTARVSSGACEGSEERITPVWNDHHREVVRAAVLGTGQPYAAATWDRLQRGLDGYVADWAAAHHDACAATALRHEQSPEALDRRMACLQRASTHLASTIGVLKTTDAASLARSDDLLASLPDLERCADLTFVQTSVRRPDDPGLQRLVDQVERDLAKVQSLHVAGRFDDAALVLDRVSERLRDVDDPPLLARLRFWSGQVHDARGLYVDAERDLKRGLWMALQVEDDELAARIATTLTTVVGIHRGHRASGLDFGEMALGLALRPGAPSELEAWAAASQADVLLALGRYDEAVTLHRRALADLSRSSSPNDPRIAQARVDASAALLAAGHPNEALELATTALEQRRRHLGPTHPKTAEAHNDLALVFDELGRFDDAQEHYRKSLELYEAALGSSHPDTQVPRSNLATLLSSLGKHREALDELRGALERMEDSLGTTHPDIASVRTNIGLLEFDRGNYEAARHHFEAALEIRTTSLGLGHPEVGHGHGNIALALEGLGRFEEARAEHERAVDLLIEALGADHPDVARARNNLSLVLTGLGDPEGAERELRAAITIWKTHYGEMHHVMAVFRNGLGNALDLQGRSVETEEEYRAALQIELETLGPEHPTLIVSHADLAGLLADRGAWDEARASYERAWALTRASEVPSETVGTVAFGLAQVYWHFPRQRAEARRLAEIARGAFAGTPDRNAQELALVEQWLRSHRR